ncbi:hypothetical protein Tsubulata_023038, partial [Turnera subulata]
HLQDIREADRGLFLNGALHWGKKDAKKITAFDLAEEKFYDFPAPPELRGLGHKGLGIVGEYLYMSRLLARTVQGSVVWVMKEYLNAKSWVPFIDYRPSLGGQYCSVRCHCNFIADSLQVKEDEGCLMFYIHGCVQILKWDKNLGKSDKDGVDEGEVKVKYYEHWASIPYRESLASPYPSLEKNQGF